MIYLGIENGKYYIIHDFSGFYKPQQDGNAKYYKVREVMVSPLILDYQRMVKHILKDYMEQETLFLRNNKFR